MTRVFDRDMKPKIIYKTKVCMSFQVGFAVAMTKAIPTVVKQWASTGTDGNLDHEVQSLMKSLSSKFVRYPHFVLSYYLKSQLHIAHHSDRYYFCRTCFSRKT